MAGHSKWANIKHRKARVDAKKGKFFSKLAKEIMVAARDGGGDPEANINLRTLIQKARGKRLTPDEYEGGTITVSNLGMFGVTNFLPIINPGQASILGVGKIEDKPVVMSGGITVRKMMAVTLAIDHRISDGATAASFLQVMKDALESPRESLA